MEERMGEAEWHEKPQLPVDWRELGVLVLDGSQAMIQEIETKELGVRTKTQAINSTVRELFTRFKNMRSKHQYTFAVVKFHEYVTDEFPPTPVTEIDDFGDYNPTSAGTGETFIGSGLEHAGEICEQFFQGHTDNIPISATVILVTSSECIMPKRTKEIATKLKADNRIRLAVSCLAEKGMPLAPLELLQEICSDPHEHYLKVAYDTTEMARFWRLLLSPPMSKLLRA
jgi:hypothetical protein